MGSSCQCLTPCADAAAPACNGDCLAGLVCIDAGSGCECLTACADTTAPQCGGACLPLEECKDGGSGCVCIRCGDYYLGPGEECDDGNVVDGDGCSSECLCNPETTPGVCNLTGVWIAEIATPPFPPWLAEFTFIEDGDGNATFTITQFPFMTDGTSTRSDSCGTGTVTVVGIPAPMRLTVGDDCNSMIMIETDWLTIMPLERL